MGSSDQKELNTIFPSFQKQQIKVAFAEGYLAGSNPEHGGQKGGRAMRYLKVHSDL